jgi:hypothetical protein
LGPAEKLKNEVDELYNLPLAEFIGARNELAARLKQSGRANDANLVKTLVKPPISAWTVNQLYWKHREAFDNLLNAGQHFRRAQTSGKIADMRESLEARREALLDLSELATTLLQDAGHNPGPDAIRRITTTLEAISAHASPSDNLTLGRLSQDVDPPGFESLASFVPAAGATKREPARTTASQKTKASDARKAEETRQVKIAAAKSSLQAARKSLVDARTRAQSLEAAQKKIYTEAKQAEKQLREAEERLKKASAASEVASQRSQTIAKETEEAASAVEDGRRAVEKASKELELLFGATD